MRFRRPAKVDPREWHTWYAWWPVSSDLYGNHWYCWMWLETVERKRRGPDVQGWVYSYRPTTTGARTTVE